MADWYASSAAYGLISAFVPSVAYTVGQIVKPTAPAAKAQWVFRCTTAGTASTEPAWPTANNATITTGGAIFTNVTGQSTYAWSAAAGDIPTLIGAVGANRFAAGDRMFVSSDHSETQSVSTVYGSGVGGTASYSFGQVLSVNRGGSVPPAAADLTAGAAVSVTGANYLSIDTIFPVYHYGISFNYAGTTGNAIVFGQGGAKALFFDACQLYLNTATSTCHITAANVPINVILNNTTLRFGNTGQTVYTTAYLFELTWLNTPAAIAGATIPLTLFAPSSNDTPLLATMRGVDLSAITGTLVTNGTITGCGSKFLFDSCKIAPGVTRYSNSTVSNTRDLVELVNCFDGTNILNESYQPAGAVTTERTITLSGGAADDVGAFSHKMVSNANIDDYVNTLNSFWMDVENTSIGVSHTATVEIVASASLNNNDISLLLEYQGTSGSSVASFVNTLPVNILTANAAVTSSAAAWNSSPATPVYQHLQATFTPQVKGRVRGQVRLGKASATVWVNPQITIT